MGAWRLRRDSDQQGGLLPAHGATRLTKGKVMAYNIVASVRSEALKPFQLKALDQLASIGRRQNSRHQLLRVYRVVALTNDLFAKITTASESPLDSLKTSDGYLTISHCL